MNKIIFKLVAYYNVAGFETEVQRLLDDDYFFQGELIVTQSDQGPQYTQMMIKDIENDT